MKMQESKDIVSEISSNPRLKIARAAGRFSRSMMSLANKKIQEAGYDLSLEHAIILKNLMEKDGQSHQELADNTFKHKTSITFLIDNMVKRNLVVRVPDQLDRRSKLIYLTTHGRDLLDEISPILFRQMHKVTEKIDEEELELCVSVLERLFTNTKYLLDQENHKNGRI